MSLSLSAYFTSYQGEVPFTVSPQHEEYSVGSLWRRVSELKG